MTPQEIRETRTERFLAQAAAIVDSAAVLSTYAACEWADLDENGQLWIAAIVRETHARAAELGPDGLPPRARG